MSDNGTTCAWFALCDHAAIGTTAHPVLGDVAVCQRCAERFGMEVKLYPHTSEFETHELSVCGDCLQLMANGEINDGTDAAERTSKGQAEVWGDDARHLVPGGGRDDDDGKRGFSWCSCDGCGSVLGGDRFQAYALIPKR